MFKKILLLLLLLLCVYFGWNNYKDESVEIINTPTFNIEEVKNIEIAIKEKIEESISDKIEKNKELNNPNLLILDYNSDVKILNIEEKNSVFLVEVEEIRTYFYNEGGPETISKNIHTFRLFQENGRWAADFVKDGSKIY